MEEFYTERHSSLREAPLITRGSYTQLLRSYATGFETGHREGDAGTLVSPKEGDSVAGSERGTKAAPLLGPHLACSPQHASRLTQGQVLAKYSSIESLLWNLTDPFFIFCL